MTQKKLILIVDDNPHNLKVLGNTLTEQGYRMRFAKSGLQALEIIKKKKPDLILLDIMMPEMDGFEVCRVIKQDTNMAGIPIIFLSAKTEKDDVIDGLELGAVDYISKPFHQKELLMRVKTHIRLKTIEEELKNALNTKDKFFSIIAHDLGNLFSGIVGLLNILVVRKNDPKKLATYLPLMQQSAEMGYNLLINLLEWSRIQTGKIKHHPNTLDVKSIVDMNVKLLENQAQQKNIKIISDIDNITVFADTQMFDTVIRNLLSNAIKFTPKNGFVEISYRQLETDVEISIQDTGVGISSENIDKLFKIDESYTTKGTDNESGTGLGLTLCKEFVDKNGGCINVESELDKGSRFFIHLPSSKK